MPKPCIPQSCFSFIPLEYTWKLHPFSCLHLKSELSLDASLRPHVHTPLSSLAGFTFSRCPESGHCPPLRWNRLASVVSLLVCCLRIAVLPSSLALPGPITHTAVRMITLKPGLCQSWLSISRKRKTSNKALKILCALSREHL